MPAVGTWRTHDAGVHGERRVVGGEEHLATDPLVPEHEVQGADRPADVEHHGAAVDVVDRLQRPVAVSVVRRGA